MDDLKLPVFKSTPQSGKWVSMDDYFRFVIFNIAHTVDMKAARKKKRMSCPCVPFDMK